MRCRELATSPHICFPAFGLLATLGCMISFTDCTGSSLQQTAQLSLFPCSCAANIVLEKNTIFASNPTPFNCCHVVEGSSVPTECHPTIAQQLHQSQPRLPSRNTFLYRPVMYENLLLSQTAESQSYRCLSASKLGRSDGCCALLMTSPRFTHWLERPRRRFNLCYNYFSDPLALTFWGDFGGACGGMQVRMDDVHRWL